MKPFKGNFETNTKKRLLHVFPGSTAPRFFQSGGGKGIKIFEDYFKKESISLDTLVLKKKSDLELVKNLIRLDIQQYSHVFIHYPMFILSAIYLKICYPNIVIIVRSHNAEFPHWLHHSFLELKAKNFKRSLVCFLTALRNGIGEIFMGVFANYILAITEWEAESYWGKRAFRAKVLYAPYYLTHHAGHKQSSNNITKNRCVCLMAPSHSSFLQNAAENFINLVSNSRDLNAWTFCITGDSENLPDASNSDIDKVGFLDDIGQFLRDSHAVAILTEYGFGFKTKILEAAAEGCWSLVPEKAMFNIPRGVREFCIPIDISSQESFADALKKCSKKIPDFKDNNENLKLIAHQSISKTLSC